MSVEWVVQSYSASRTSSTFELAGLTIDTSYVDRVVHTTLCSPFERA